MNDVHNRQNFALIKSIRNITVKTKNKPLKYVIVQKSPLLREDDRCEMSDPFVEKKTSPRRMLTECHKQICLLVGM